MYTGISSWFRGVALVAALVLGLVGVLRFEDSRTEAVVPPPIHEPSVEAVAWAHPDELEPEDSALGVWWATAGVHDAADGLELLLDNGSDEFVVAEVYLSGGLAGYYFSYPAIVQPLAPGEFAAVEVDWSLALGMHPRQEFYPTRISGVASWFSNTNARIGSERVQPRYLLPGSGGWELADRSGQSAFLAANTPPAVQGRRAALEARLSALEPRGAGVRLALGSPNVSTFVPVDSPAAPISEDDSDD